MSNGESTGPSPDDLAHSIIDLDGEGDLSLDQLQAMAGGDATSNTGVTSATPGAEAADTTVDDPAAEAAAAASAAAPAAAPAPAPAQQDGEGPIATRDGKSTIPYAVLRDERMRRGHAEETAKRLEEELRQLKSAGNTGADVGAVAEVAELDADVMQALEEEAPALAKVVKSMADQAKSLRDQIQQLQGRERAEEQDRQVDNELDAQGQLENAIAKTPDLATWRADKPALWNQAAQFDAVLRQQPEWQGKSLEERFAKAADMVRLANNLGPAAAPAAAAPAAPDAAARAAAAVATAASASPQINTLSGLPGGAAPNTNPLDNLEGSSALAISNMMDNMSADQLEAFLARAM